MSCIDCMTAIELALIFAPEIGRHVICSRLWPNAVGAIEDGDMGKVERMYLKRGRDPCATARWNRWMESIGVVSVSFREGWETRAV